MGSWGAGSDENDCVYDALGFGIGDRVRGLAAFDDGDEQLKECNRIFNDDIMPEVVGKTGYTCGITLNTFAGVVMWGLRHGLTVNANYLEQVKISLKNEREQCQEDIRHFIDKGEEPESWDLRRCVTILEEIEEIDAALANGGRSSGKQRSRTLMDRFNGER